MTVNTDSALGSSSKYDSAELKRIIEAILIVAESPVSVGFLADLLSLSTITIENTLEELQVEFSTRGFQLRQVGGGWRFYTNPAYEGFVKQFVVGTDTAKFSQAALETLAVIAYRQPISKTRISSIRGVNVDSVVRNLAARNLIAEAGTSPSGATLWVTTPAFLEKLGLNDLTELTPLAPFLPGADELEELAEEI